MDVVIERLPDIRVAAVRALGPYAQSAPKAWSEMSSWIAKQNLLSEHTIFMGLRHDSSAIPPESLRYDAAVSIAEEIDPNGIAVECIVPGGEFAVFTHQGPYDSINDAWDKLYWEWLPGSGRVPAMQPNIEIYLSDTTFSADKEILTRLLLPLQAV